MQDYNTTQILTSLGALGGIVYGVTKAQGFWATAGYTLLFSIGGAALGNAIEAARN
jgi:hypothetical protein